MGIVQVDLSEFAVVDDQSYFDIIVSLWHLKGSKSRDRDREIQPMEKSIGTILFRAFPQMTHYSMFGEDPHCETELWVRGVVVDHLFDMLLGQFKLSGDR